MRRADDRMFLARDRARAEAKDRVMYRGQRG